MFLYVVCIYQTSVVMHFLGKETLREDLTLQLRDQYQYLGNCAPTPPLTQQVITS